MSWLDNVLSALGLARKASAPPFQRAVAEYNSYRTAELGMLENQQKAYLSVGWVYFCVSYGARAGAMVKGKVLKRVKGEEELEQVPNHPFELLLRRPNLKLSRFALLEATLGSLDLTGNAYWWLNVVGGKPVEIWPLRADRMTPVPDPKDYVKGYIYEIGGQQIPLDPEEVVHFKTWHPNNDYVGFSPVQAASLAIQTDQESARWNAAFFGVENAMPPQAVIFKASINDVDYERAKKEWQANYGGSGNQHKTAFIRGANGEVDIKTFGIPHKDMEFLEGRRWSKDEIFHIFGVPLGLWSESATEANANIADRVYKETTLWPKLSRIAEQINLEIVQPLYGDEFEFQFDDIRPVDRAQDLRELDVVAKYALMTEDEMRSRYFTLGPKPKPTPEELAAQAALMQPSKTPTIEEPDKIQELFKPTEDVVKQEDQSKDAALRDLRLWRSQAVNRFVSGRPMRLFESSHIPASLSDDLMSSILKAASIDDIKAAFDVAIPFVGKATDAKVIEGTWSEVFNDINFKSAQSAVSQERDERGRFAGDGSSSHDDGTPFVGRSEFESIKFWADRKIKNAPVPTAEDVAKARLDLENARRNGGDSRGGSAEDRRRQRLNLFNEFDGGNNGYVPCHGCGLKLHYSTDETLNAHKYALLERGKIFTKSQGGGYQLPNLLPECFGCNRSRGDTPIRLENLP